MRTLWVMGFCVLACGPSGADASVWGNGPTGPLDLRASLSAEDVPLMEELILNLDLFRQADLAVSFRPQAPEGFHGEADPPIIQPLDSGTWERHVLRLRPVRTGNLTIPPFVVEAEGTGDVATTVEFNVNVTSLLADEGDEAEAPAPPFPSPFPWQRWVLIAVGAILAIAGLLFWRHQRRGPLRVGDEVPLSAHAKALRELARLRKAPRRTRSEIEAFYVAVSHVLRLYLEERFGLRAPERTTEEFLSELESGESLLTEHRYALRKFLEQCDLVKFAGMLPPESVHEDTFRIAEQVVESTRPDRIKEGAA